MTNKKTVFFATSTTVILILLIMLTTFSARAMGAIHRAFGSKFFFPVIPLIPREYDNFGSGAYGASRDGGKRKHRGQDYVTTPGQPVFAPISGKVTISSAYASGKHPELRMVKITNGQTVVDLMYVLPSVSGYVEAGQMVGTAQSLQNIYNGITNHIHVQVRFAGIFTDPKPYFEPDKEQA